MRTSVRSGSGCSRVPHGPNDGSRRQRSAGGRVMGSGVVLVLDGPSSVGKSTTLAALQRRWPTVRSGPLVVAGLDATRALLGPGGRGRWTELVERVEPSV